MRSEDVLWPLSGFKLGDIAPKSQFPSFPRSLGNNWLEFSRPSQELPLQVWAQPRFALLREIESVSLISIVSTDCLLLYSAKGAPVPPRVMWRRPPCLEASPGPLDQALLQSLPQIQHQTLVIS